MSVLTLPSFLQIQNDIDITTIVTYRYRYKHCLSMILAQQTLLYRIDRSRNSYIEIAVSLQKFTFPPCGCQPVIECVHVSNKLLHS